MINSILNSNLNIKSIRHDIYHSSGPGYFVLKNFITENTVNKLRSFWLNTAIDQSFYDFIPNRSVKVGSPNYFYKKPSKLDRTYCCFLWNEPLCQQTHELALEIQQIRNIVEGLPNYHGLFGIEGHNLQYRVCNHVSPEQIVYPHGDFIEQERKDAGGSHEFDPSRIQATLFLSEHETDYDGGGFVLDNNQGEETNLAALGIMRGDLVLWRYGNIHQVKNIQISGQQTGFMRIIYPTYELDSTKTSNTSAYKLEALGRVNGKMIYQAEEENL